jgi:hypothetical protein
MSTGLPYPTPTRLRLAEAIARGQIHHYPFTKPETYDETTGNLVTARVAEFVAAGLAGIPEPSEHNYATVEHNYATVVLTAAGRAWVERAKNRDNEAGPGSTSPESGPCPAHNVHPHDGMRCLDCPECIDGTLADVKRRAAESRPATGDGVG